jgi:hypothetical protein
MSDPSLTDIEWEQHLERLGEPTASFRVRGIFLQLAIGSLMILAGLALLISLAVNIRWAKGGDFHHLYLLVLMPVMGGAAIWHALRSRGLHVLVYPTGVLRVDRREVKSCLWAELDRVTFTPKTGAEVELRRGPGRVIEAVFLKVPQPWLMTWKSKLTLHRRDGTDVECSAQLKRYGEFVRLVQEETFVRTWPAACATFASGGDVAFGDIRLNTAGIATPTGLLPWGDVKKVSIAAAMLQIFSKRKWLPWYTQAGADSLPNLHVMLALVAVNLAEPEADESEDESS